MHGRIEDFQETFMLRPPYRIEPNTFHMHYRNANLLGRIIIWEALQKMDDGNFIVNMVKQVTLKLESYTSKTEEIRNADNILV
jgi:hypothetical protein